MCCFVAFRRTSSCERRWLHWSGRQTAVLLVHQADLFRLHRISTLPHAAIAAPRPPVVCHTHAHKHTHTDTHTCTCTRTRTDIHIHTPTHTRKLTLPCSLAVDKCVHPAVESSVAPALSLQDLPLVEGKLFIPKPAGGPLPGGRPAESGS